MSELTNKFYVEEGLYDKHEIKNLTKDVTFKLIYTTDSIDCHCVECGRNSVFKPIENWPEGMIAGHIPVPITNPSMWKIDIEKTTLLIEKNFSCSRNADHKMRFFTLIDQSHIQKIGQYPSASDLNIDNIKQFKGILKNDYFKEYSKAIGLFSHGIGIGSFVYLRRIIENFIIKPALETARKEGAWDEVEYQKKRMKERIDVLKDFLPKFLVDNKNLYSVISKGIHELKEEECLEYFPVVQAVLDLILTEMKDKIEIENKKAEMQSKLSTIASKIS